MGLVLKYVVISKAGTFHYRRRVPQNVTASLAKREFKKLLGSSEREALAAYPRYHAQVEREIAEAIKVQNRAASRGPETDREAYVRAADFVSGLERMGTPDHLLDITADTIIESYTAHPDTGEPLGVSTYDGHAIRLLRRGVEQSRAPAPTLEDAKRLYIAEQLEGPGKDPDSRASGRVDRVIGYVVETLGRNPVVSTLTRDDARKVRDQMLLRLKSNGERISPSSVARELNDIKAVVSFAKKEMSLPGDFQNPFNDLSVGRQGALVAESDGRQPLPPAILSNVRARVLDHAAPELALIWRLLQGTGCRLGEVAGLRVQDIVLDGPLGATFPHLKVTWHEDRRVKTKASLRHVPLVSDALDAATEALRLARNSHMVFPSYGRSRGPDSASAALMKHVRRVTDDPKHVVHSLRHNMKDNLDLAEVSALDRNLIMGWSLGGVGDRVYGGDMRALRVTTRAMKRAMGVPLSQADKRTARDED